jgi:NHLM bacteriocin system ABC transporter ATP-binding protein
MTTSTTATATIALEAFAPGLAPRRSRLPTADGPPLLMAARAVGEALGVTMRPAAPSENPATLRDPLRAIARASHLRLRRVRLSDNWWQHDCGPLLAYTREDHRPVALLPVAATRYVLFDPLHHTRTPVQARLAATLAPQAYTFYRPFPQRALRWLDLLTFGLRGCGKDLLLVLLSGLAVTLLGMLAPYTTAIMIDTAIPDADRRMVLQLGAALLAAACGQPLLQLAQGWALLRQHTTAGAALQAALWDRLLTLPTAFFRQYATGDLQMRVMAISTIQQQLSGTTLRTLCTSSLALLNLGLLFCYSPPLALVALAVALVACMATLTAGVLTVRQERALQHLKGVLLGLTVQLITGVSKLRVAGAEARAFAVWGTLFSQQQHARQRQQRIADILAVLNAVLPTVAAVGLFWWAIRLFQSAEASGLTAGTFMAFHAAFGLFLSGATSLSTTLIDVLEVTALWERARPIVEATPEVHTGQSDPGLLTGTLALEHVTFRYREHGPAILDDVSLHATPGEFIALVGPSGSGKSTLLRLLLGFETPEAGAVSYDGQELSRLDVRAVRRQVGSVLQQNTLMAGTIFEHIAGSALITQEDAWEAVRAAGLAEDIAALPMGLHTFVSEGGSNLSGGQRQRLLIARALVGKPAIVLFDEATSALDNRTQAVVTTSLARLQVTRVVIAHRLSTIQAADRIYVLAGGRVVQQGTFTELARQAGLFAQLMARQESEGKAQW